MTFKQITDSFDKRFYDLSSSLCDHQYKFNHLELDPDSSYFEFDSERKKEYAVIICECYRDLVALSSDIATFVRFATKETEKEVLWKLHCDVDDYYDKFFDFVHDVRVMYHWEY